MQPSWASAATFNFYSAWQFMRSLTNGPLVLEVTVKVLLIEFVVALSITTGGATHFVSIGLHIKLGGPYILQCTVHQ